MKTRELAALSQIAEILSDNNKSPIIPSEDIWKKIFCGAELEDLFEEEYEYEYEEGEEGDAAEQLPQAYRAFHLRQG